MILKKTNKDDDYIDEALKEARLGFASDEVPVGAIVVCNNKIIAKAHNQVEMLNDVTAHAEILAITAAAQYLGSKYLNDCTLYVTLEPCPMCASASNWAQIGSIVWGADDEKNGFIKMNTSMLHPKTKVKKGIHADMCSELMTDFFRKKRT